MPNWLYLIPFLWFCFSAVVKYIKSGGQKIVMLGDFVIATGFLYQLVFPEGSIGFYIAGAGVVFDLTLYVFVQKQAKSKQSKRKEE
ncbi:MAG TPA: hypothetical protein P5107_00100 [Thermotogota bacterium]|nr:hypothetical protein [Thermotogota bacterium]HRW33438.1 hypothetical protein [Thermotogota bacterium]